MCRCNLTTMTECNCCAAHQDFHSWRAETQHPSRSQANNSCNLSGRLCRRGLPSKFSEHFTRRLSGKPISGVFRISSSKHSKPPGKNHMLVQPDTLSRRTFRPGGSSCSAVQSCKSRLVTCNLSGSRVKVFVDARIRFPSTTMPSSAVPFRIRAFASCRFLRLMYFTFTGGFSAPAFFAELNGQNGKVI